MRIHIQKISPGSLSSTLALVYAVLGLLVGVIGASGSLIRSATGGRGVNPITGTDWDIIPMLILYPVLFAIIGAISGFVVAWIYNAVARLTKGVLIEFSEARRQDD